MPTKLAKIMDDRGVGQHELSRRTGISQPQIWCYYHGKKLPGALILRVLATALDVKIDDIVDDSYEL